MIFLFEQIENAECRFLVDLILDSFLGMQDACAFLSVKRIDSFFDFAFDLASRSGFD